MTLKVISLNKKLELKRKDLEKFDQRELELKEEMEKLEASIDEIETEEELATLESSIDETEKELTEITEQKKSLSDEIEKIEKEVEEARNNEPKGEIRTMTQNLEERKVLEERKLAEDYIRFKQERDGLKKSDLGVLLPVHTVYTPTKEVLTIQDLSKLVTKTTVKNASGKYPVLKRATAKLRTVEELEKNPELAKPEFINVEWKVDTYRGSIAVSQESIDDSEVDLINLINTNAIEQKVNTTNEAIATVLKSFTAKTITNVDELKKLVNVELDAGYDRKFIVSQSFFQAIDTVKDKNGRYILNDNIAGATNAYLLGYPVVVVNDTLLGNAGEAKAFIGDVAKAVLFADRAEIGVRWADHLIYGQYLAVGMRFGVTKVDEKAGYFVTLNIPQV